MKNAVVLSLSVLLLTGSWFTSIAAGDEPVGAKPCILHSDGNSNFQIRVGTANDNITFARTAYYSGSDGLNQALTAVKQMKELGICSTVQVSTPESYRAPTN